MQTIVAGWDIGGAHLKAVLLDQDKSVIGVYQRPCEMWKGLDKLRQAVQEMLSLMTVNPNRHVVTMTGELADIFPSRDEGVRAILAAMHNLLPSNTISVYAGKEGIIQLADVTDGHATSIASANWLASASMAAQQIGNGLFIDIGSTTTDILIFADGKVLAEGYSDYDRLISQELVYTGIVRTPLMAVAHTVQDQGKEVSLMAEYFATMADVYRLTGELDENHDQTPTADGDAKTVEASARRIARMLGCDYHDNELPRWREVSGQFRLVQLARIQAACYKQLIRVAMPVDAPLVGGGVGQFLVRELAERLGRPYLDFAGLFSGSEGEKGLTAGDCAPAAAVAALFLSKERQVQT